MTTTPARTGKVHPNCQACYRTRSGEPTFLVPHRHTDWDEVYTFGVGYPSRAHEGYDYEEVDVAAESASAAERLVRAYAAVDLMPGHEVITQMPTGGSGGWFQVL